MGVVVRGVFINLAMRHTYAVRSFYEELLCLKNDTMASQRVK